MGIEEVSPGKWKLDWRDSQGKRRRKYITGSKRKAEAAMAEIIAQRQIGRDDPRALLRVTVSEILDIYLRERREGKGSEDASRDHAERINAKWGETKLESLDKTPHMLDHWLQRQLPLERSKRNAQKVISQKTVWNIYATFQAALTHYIRSRRLHMPHPLAGVRIEKGTQVRTQCPRADEFARILEEAKQPGNPPILWRLFVAGWESGQRINEILSWRWEDITMDPPEGERPWIRQRVSKQRNSRTVDLPMSRPLWEALKGIPGPKETGKVWYWAKAPWDQIRGVLDRAGFPEYIFHDFRRSWNSRMKAKGVSPALTRRYQPHSDAMDTYYTHLARHDLEQIINDTW